MVEVDRNYPTKGQVNLNTVLGSLGTAAFAGNVLPFLGGMLGGNCCNNMNGVCSENMGVNRYEVSMVRELTNKDMEIAYLKGRDASKTDDLELYKYIDGQIRRIDRELADQRVFNATTGATVSCLTGQVNGMQALLNSITKTVVPNSAICPGWGDVTVSITPTTTPATGA